jgi:4'-phosphopantetheinyl transferase
VVTPNPDLVTLRWLPLDTIEAARWPALARVLDETEHARAERFYFEGDRQAYIAAHALTRTTLARRFDREPELWRFVAGAHGKPDIDDRALQFNLSHTRGLVAVAVTQASEVGVDVERVDPKHLGPDVTERFFAPAECAYLRSLPPEGWTEAAYAFWTLKEAYIKAIGLGLACPLNAFHFVLDPLGVRFSSRIADDPAQWRFQRWRPTRDHAMALGVRHADPNRLQIDARPVRDDELPR